MAVTSVIALFAIFVSQNSTISHKLQDAKTVVFTNHSSALSKLHFFSFPQNRYYRRIQSLSNAGNFRVSVRFLNSQSRDSVGLCSSVKCLFIVEGWRKFVRILELREQSA